MSKRVDDIDDAKILSGFNAICFPSLGLLKLDGSVEIGGGVVRHIANVSPNFFSSIFGIKIRENGLILQEIFSIEIENQIVSIVFFPMRSSISNITDFSLIKKNIEELKSLTNVKGWEKVLITKIGHYGIIGVGALLRELDDRFYIVNGINGV